MKIAGFEGVEQLANLRTDLAGGTFVVYGGVEPAGPDGVLVSDTVLATLTFQTPAFAATTLVSNFEQMSAQFVAASVMPTAAGTAGFVRCFKSDGVSAACDLTVGVGTGDVQFANTLAISTSYPLGPVTWTVKSPVNQ